MDHADFATFFNEKVKARGYSLKKLADVSGVPLVHLTNISTGRYGDLPPAPYLRGYLSTLGPILDFDAQAVWPEFRRIHLVKASGAEDELPHNRFAGRSRNMRNALAAAVVCVIVLGYVGYQSGRMFGTPKITVLFPQDDMQHVKESAVTISGELVNGSVLTVNGENVQLHDGAWETRIELRPGQNTVVLSAKKLLGGETQLTRRIFYDVPANVTDTVPAANP
ncbi:MAG: hypothetical protein RL681_674 [Candidatus Parcubacteria bacterium]|jgi:cytoskeletal protein RodZ